jgi:hypothetical protein
MDFDFQRYIQTRQSDRVDSRGAQTYREYAFGSDVSVLRTLDRARVVALALKATTPVERRWLEGEVLAGAVKAGPGAHPALRELSHDAAKVLGMGTPAVYVTAAAGVPAAAVVVGGQPRILIAPALLETLEDAALRFVLGRQMGHLQNSHGPYLTCALALHHLEDARWGWLVKPAAAALGSWQHLGDITADRAGLLACGDIEAARAALSALLGVEDAGLDEAERRQRRGRWEVRGRALECFAAGELYRKSRGLEGGTTPKDVDREVERVLKVE